MGKVKPENEWKFKCANTGKAIKRKKRYYRNGKYYLNKASWQAQAKKEGMLTMFEDGLYKAAKGITSVEEVLRVITE